MENQIIYTTSKASVHSNRVCAELNAAVLSATFQNTEGVCMADLYTSDSSCSMLVAHGTCAPIGLTYAATCQITFN